MQKRWMLKRNNLDMGKLSRETGVDEMLVSILVNRGIRTGKQIRDFMNPTLDKLEDPSLMKDMDRAVDIIMEAMGKQENIAVYGDYDADGITSTFILYSALRECGARVKYHIPDRVKEGYGINTNSIEKLNREGFNTIITCDNGIAAVEEVKRAKTLGMKIVITDHHDVPPLLPPADALVNPKQDQCGYPFKKLCGAGVAFKFVQLLYNKMGKNCKDALKFMEYAAIGTICDVVDLVGENRIIAKQGLDMINRTKNLGLRYLMEENSLEPGNITAYHIGFIIGPCINAAGRLENAEMALQLLLSEDNVSARKLANELRKLNIERQQLTEKGFQEVSEMIESSKLKKDRVLVVYREDIHESIAGIVAGRLKEKYNLPSIVLTAGKNAAKGSGRSIEEYDMFRELSKFRSLFESFGGHKMAAGMSIKQENISELRTKLNEECSLTDEELVPKIRIDRRVPLEDVTFHMIDRIKYLEPFGKGNPSPLFAEKNIEVFRVYFMGKEKKAVKFFCRLKNGFKKMDAISFEGVEKFRNMACDVLENDQINRSIFMDFIFYPCINEYKGVKNIQLMVKDFRLSHKL